MCPNGPSGPRWLHCGQPPLLCIASQTADSEQRYRFESARLLPATPLGGWVNSPLPSDARRLGFDVGVTSHPVKPLASTGGTGGGAGGGDKAAGGAAGA